MNIQQTYFQRLANLENNTSDLRPFLDDLSNDISKVVDIPPIRQLLNTGQKKGTIEAVISLLILKAANRLSVGNNLKNGQAEEIAQQIMIDYPLLSLDDINILLLNGTKGKYGEIYRMDISVIYNWIRQYEAEKAEIVETKHKKEKDVITSIPDLPDDIQIKIDQYLNKLKKAEGMRLMDKVSRKELEDAKKPLESIAQSKGFKYGSPTQIWMNDMRAQYGRECCDLFTGRTLPGQLPFDEWLKFQEIKID